MKRLPNTLQAQASRAIASAATVAALAVALPSAAMGMGGGQTASPAALADKQTVAQATTQPASATKSTAMAKTTKGSHADRVEARIKELYAKLKISPAQEDKWNALTQVMRDNARTLDSLMQTRIENANSMSALDDVKSYSQITDAHAEGVKKFVPAFEALYDSMSESQKKEADQLFRGPSRTASKSAAKGK